MALPGSAAMESAALPPEYVPSTPSRSRWPFVLIVVVGLGLILGPLVTGMFLRAVQGEAMLASFQPLTSSANVERYRDDLAVLGDAQANVVTLQAAGQANGEYRYVDTFVRDYPAIRADMTTMLDAIDDNRNDFERLTELPPFGTLPWLLALPGAGLVWIGIVGARRAAGGRATRVAEVGAGVLAAFLIVTPITLGLFANASAAEPVLDGFTPILTHEEVRKVQGYFVTLVGAEGEIDSRFATDVRAAHPDADLRAIDTLHARWQPMTSEFASLVGTMNDNIENFDAVVALNNSTRPLGFPAFAQIGWFFVVPGLLVGAAVARSVVREGVRT